MGERLAGRTFTREDRQRFRAKVRVCMDAFARMLAEERFAFDVPLTGLEVELNLVDADGRPAFANDAVLERIGDPAFVEELGQFNLEINLAPHSLRGSGAEAFEAELRLGLNAADGRAGEVGARMVMIGILPTLTAEHLTRAAISSNPRYALLDEQVLLARGEDIELDVRGGPESLHVFADSIAPEAACTSAQFHLQVSPEEFAPHWNAAQCLAGVQVAVGANSPWFLGAELWRESRVAVFTQAADTRPAELKAQGVRPRVWFGEGWITSVFDLFEENTRYFSALLPVIDDEDPLAVLDSGHTPALHELRLHNGTVWRWNRPVYDVVDDRPHLRIENRVLPAGPTVVDLLANGALYFGALRALAGQERPIWSQMSFGAAEDNFAAGALDGLDARLYWPGMGEVAVTELVLRRLLPLAHQGLSDWGVDQHIIDRLLGIIEGRCTSGCNGATWQVDSVRALERRGLDRFEALRVMTVEYASRMHSNVPAHEWSAVE